MDFYTSIFYQMLSERDIAEYFEKYIERDVYSVTKIDIHIVLSVINEIINQKSIDEKTKYEKIQEIILFFHKIGFV